MKKNKLSVLTYAMLLLAAYSGNSQNQMVSSHQMEERGIDQKNEIMKDEIMKSQTIRLKKGELFLVISSITKPNAQDLMNDYFGKVFPVASKNGFKPLVSLSIDKIVSGNYKPNNFVGLYSWPNMNAVQEFLKELPNSELTPMRKKIWEELKQVMVGVEMDFEFILHNDKVYEFQTIWNDMPMDKNENKSLVEKYNGKVVLSCPVAGYEDLNGGKKPSQVVLIEWSSEKIANKYRRKRKKHMGEESLLTHLMIPEKMSK